jgi:hypothetical protein
MDQTASRGAFPTSLCHAYAARRWPGFAADEVHMQVLEDELVEVHEDFFVDLSPVDGFPVHIIKKMVRMRAPSAHA